MENFIKYRKELHFLSIQIIKKNNLETLFGVFWSFFQPMVYILTFYIFFVFNLKGTGLINGHSMIVFMISGNMPWMLMSQCTTNGPLIFWKNVVFINNIKFPVVIVPLAEVLAKLYVHIVVMLVVFIIFTFLGYPPTIYYLNFIYIWIIMTIFLNAISRLLGCLSIFFQDTDMIVRSLMIPLFYISPILWHPVGNVVLYEKIFNPFYYFIELYRQTLLYKEWFFTDIKYDIYIWIIICLLQLLSISIYIKARPKFADVI